MTTKQKLFCDKYIDCRNGTEAAIFAGYKEKTAKHIAYQLLQRLEIQDYIQKRIDKISRKLEINKEWVLQQLVDNVEIAKNLPDKPDLASANQALKMIGTELGMFNPAKQIDIDVTYANKSDEELKAILADYIIVEDTPCLVSGDCEAE